MDVIHRRCAGLDVHKKTVMVCVRLMSDGGRVTKRVREFGTMTHELRNMRDWLASQDVTHVAMESTGVYWKPIWNVLDEGSFELLLCNARHIKQVPGRKTDVKDCEWIAQLLQHGLLTGSFVPSRGQRDLRDLTRTRAKLIDEKTRHANRLQKHLEDTNLKLGSVASDVLGASGRSMIEALIAGEDDPEALAKLARGKLRAKIPTLRFALEGRVTEHHRFMLRLHYEQICHLERVIEEMDARIATLMGSDGASLTVREDNLLLFPGSREAGAEGPDPPGGGSGPAAPQTPEDPSSAPPKPPQSSPPGGDPCATDSNRPLAAAVELLCSIPGIATRSAENVLAELGDDMSQFPSAGHLASWAGLAPGSYESAGKQKGGRTRKGNKFLRRALTQAAWSATRTKGTYFSAQYKRLIRRGKKRAIVAVAHSILTAIYYMLDRGAFYEELGDDYFDRLNAEGLTRYHVRRLEKLGYEVTLQEESEVEVA